MSDEKHTSEGNHNPVIGIEKYTVISDSIRDSMSEKDPRKNQGHIFCKQIFASGCTAVCHMFQNPDNGFIIYTCGCFGANLCLKMKLNWISDSEILNK